MEASSTRNASGNPDEMETTANFASQSRGNQPKGQSLVTFPKLMDAANQFKNQTGAGIKLKGNNLRNSQPESESQLLYGVSSGAQ